MRSAYFNWLLLAMFVFVAACTSKEAEQQHSEPVSDRRAEVLKHLYVDRPFARNAGAAYRQFFIHVGLDGLKELEQDSDTSIALQAAWERRRKITKRAAAIPDRTDWIFEQEPIEEFLKLMAHRLQEEPPAWWAALLKNRETIPEKNIDIFEKYGEIPEGLFPPTATVETVKDDMLVTPPSAHRAVRISQSELRKIEFIFEIGSFSDIPAVAASGGTVSFVARPTIAGNTFKMLCVDSETGRSQWIATVWAACRVQLFGPAGNGPVEIRRLDDTVIVYGCGAYSMYAEGFDVKTGKCRFRFCTSYWGDFPESGKLK